MHFKTTTMGEAGSSSNSNSHYWGGGHVPIAPAKSTHHQQFVSQLNYPYSIYHPAGTAATTSISLPPPPQQQQHQHQPAPPSNGGSGMVATEMMTATAGAGAASEASPSSEQNLGFPVRLHYMLTEIHKEGIQTNIVSWQPHGR